MGGDHEQADGDGWQKLGRLGLAELEVHRRHDGRDGGADQDADCGGEGHAGDPLPAEREELGEASRQLHGGRESHDRKRYGEADRRADETERRDGGIAAQDDVALRDGKGEAIRAPSVLVVVDGEADRTHHEAHAGEDGGAAAGPPPESSRLLLTQSPRVLPAMPSSRATSLTGRPAAMT